MLGALFTRVLRKREGRDKDSTLMLLARGLAPSAWKDLKRRCPDWREVFMHCAQHKSISERVLMEELGTQLGCAVMSPIPSLSFQALNMGAVYLPEAQRGAYIPLIQESKIVACVCLDPAMVPSRWRELKVPLYLGTWTEIRQALAASEEEYRRGLARCEQARAGEMSLLAEKVLDLAIAEASRLGADEISFFQDAAALRYQFRDPAGREFQGSLDARIAGTVVAVLESLTLSPMGESIRKIGDASRVIRVIPADDGERICVSGLKETRAPAESQPKEPAGVIPFPMREDAGEEVLTPPTQAPLVFFIDDNPIFAKVLERFLSRNGIAVRYFDRAARAFEALCATACMPELLICDVNMPEVSGGEFIARVREKAEFNALPVMMLSSDDSTERRLDLYMKGADACHSKSDDPRILCAVAVRLIERRKAA